MHASNYRAQARWALRGKWKLVTGIMIAMQVVVGGFGLNQVFQLFFSEFRSVSEYVPELRQMQLNYGFYFPRGFGWVLLALSYVLSSIGFVNTIGAYRVGGQVLDDHAPTLRTLFPMNLFWKALVMNLVRGLLVSLQLMLFIIPGLIAQYRYAMADYLLAEHPEMGPIEAIRQSSRHMKGRKMDLFLLQISFFGWALLAGILPTLAAMLLIGVPAKVLVFAEMAFGWVSAAVLNSYMFTAETAFYRDVLHGSPRYQYAGSQAFHGFEDAQTPPEDGGAQAEEPVRSHADESRAREMFYQYQCSREKLRRAGALEEYEALGASSVSENSWKREYAQLLMRRFDRDARALDDLLPFIAEYTLDDLADRALMRIDRHIRQESLSAAEILSMTCRMLALLTSGVFAENPGFVERKRADISAMADRLEQNGEIDADPEAIASLRLIREMCQ